MIKVISNKVIKTLLIISSLMVQNVGAFSESSQRKIEIDSGQSILRIKYPKETVTSDTDGDYYYLASVDSIRIIPTNDVHNVAESESIFSLAPYWEISLAHELAGRKIHDIAVHKTNGSHIIYVSLEKGNNSFELKAFAIRSALSGANDSSEDSVENTIDVTNDIGLFAIKGGASDIAGEGEMAVIRDPKDGHGLLISLDSTNELIHTYSLRNPLNPFYLESFKIETKGEKDLKFSTISKSGTSFQLIGKKHNSNHSIYELRAEARIQRANALINLEKEVKGNSWIKNFLFLGLFSNLINLINDKYLDPVFTVFEMEQDPVISKLAEDVSDEEVFEYLKVNKLLTKEEIEKYRLEYNLSKANGTKWFFTVAVVVGTLKVLQIKSKAPSINLAINQYKRKLYEFSKKIIKPDSISGRYVYRISQSTERAQLAMRSKLVRNFYNMEYPAHAITTLKNQLRKAKIIGSDEVKKISRQGYQQQYDYLKSILDNNKLAVVSKNNPKLAKQITESLEMTDVFVKKVQLNRKFRTLKSQILSLLKKHHPSYKNVSLKSDEMTAYILATDMPTILSKVDELQPILRNIKNYKNKEHLRLGEKLQDVSNQLNDLNKMIQSFGTEGKVAKVWDRWAAFTQSYSRFFLPESVLKKDNLVSKFLNEYTRLDAVKIGKNHVEYVKISGEHAKSAFWLGVTDTIGETVSQTVARSTLVDPNERSIGSGDNHLELFSINGREYGIHFDLIVHDLSNLVGWWLGMPLGLAKSGMSFGAKGKVSLSKRLFDGVKKSFNPVNYTYGQSTLSLPVLKLTSWVLELDYLNDHKYNFSEEEYLKFKNRINGRLTSFSSFAERKMLGTFVNLPYVNPQFFMQAEFDKIVRSLFNSSKPGTMVSALVMPLTSGFFPNRAYGEYFGTNNPNMINLLKKFGADGILQKIDADGYTDINQWTETEKSSFFNVMLSLEMAKLSKKLPLGRNASLQEQTEWFLQVGKNLFGENFTDMSLDGLNPLIKIADKDAPAENFRYSQEAKELNDQIEAIKKKTTILPFVKEPARDNSGMVIRKFKGKKNIDTLVNLNEVISIQAKLNEVIKALGSNQDSLDRKQKMVIGIAVYDTLHLVNTFLMNNQMVDKGSSLFKPVLSKLERFYYRLKNTRVYQNESWVNFRQKNLSYGEVRANKIKLSKVATFVKRPLDEILNSNLLLFGTIPLYLWMENQVEAHIKIEEHLATLISDLQEVLFSITKVLVAEEIEGSLEKYNDLEALKDYLGVLKEKERLFESIVFNSQEESIKYLESRIYRMPKILATSGPIGMMISGGWILTHYLLYKNSKSFVKKMTDQFAPGLFKYSLILWITASQVNNLVEKNMYLHTIDFLKLHSAYYTTLLEMELVNRLIHFGPANEDARFNILEEAKSSLEKDENLLKLDSFRKRLEELSIIGSSYQE